MSDRRKRRYSTDSDSDDYIQWKISKLRSRLAKKARARLRDEDFVSPSPSSASRSTRNHRSGSHEDIFTSPEILGSDDENVPLSVIAANIGTSGPITEGTYLHVNFFPWFRVRLNWKILWHIFRLMHQFLLNLVKYYSIFYTIIILILWHIFRLRHFCGRIS